MTKQQLALLAIMVSNAETEGTGLQESLRDVLTDLMHVAASHNLDFDFAADGAAAVYNEESQC